MEMAGGGPPSPAAPRRARGLASRDARRPEGEVRSETGQRLSFHFGRGSGNPLP